MNLLTVTTSCPSPFTNQFLTANKPTEGKKLMLYTALIKTALKIFPTYANKNFYWLIPQQFKIPVIVFVIYKLLQSYFHKEFIKKIKVADQAVSWCINKPMVYFMFWWKYFWNTSNLNSFINFSTHCKHHKNQYLPK